MRSAIASTDAMNLAIGRRLLDRLLRAAEKGCEYRRRGSAMTASGSAKPCFQYRAGLSGARHSCRRGTLAERAAAPPEAPGRPGCRACSGDAPAGTPACGTGRQGTSVRVSITAASGLSGAQCHGLVGPKMPMVGVPMAAATCTRPESLDTAALGDLQREDRVAQIVARSGRAHAGPPASTISAASGVSAGPPSTQTATAFGGQRRRQLGVMTRPASACSGRPRRAQGDDRAAASSSRPRRARHCAASASGTTSSGSGQSAGMRRALRQRQRAAAVDHARQLASRPSAGR